MGRGEFQGRLMGQWSRVEGALSSEAGLKLQGRGLAEEEEIDFAVLPLGD